MTRTLLNMALAAVIVAGTFTGYAKELSGPLANPVDETEYRRKIVGSWVGNVEGMKESIAFSGDGSFTAQLRPRGFISNTLSQGVTGTISGSWTIRGRTITLQITSAEDVRVKNRATSSTILTFNQDELCLKSGQGETSTFIREISF